MTEYDPDAEGNGEYIVAVVRSAGAVSSVFQRKVKAVFEQELGGASADEWYSVADIAAAFDEIERRAGRDAMESAGRAATETLPWPEDAETVPAGLAVLNDLHAGAYRNSDRKFPAGRATFELVGDRTARVGITDVYPYPASFARGSFRGVVSSVTGGSATLTPTEPHDGERAAWTMEW